MSLRTLSCVLTLTLGACAAPDRDRSGASSLAIPAGAWRGDVSYPGLPAIGVRYVVEGGHARIIAARNMGFAGGPLRGFRVDGDSVHFTWSLNGDRYACVLRRQPDDTLLGPCRSEGEPTIGVRMVPPGNDAPTGLARTLLEMSSVRWVSVLDSAGTRVWTADSDSERVARDAVAAAVQRARADNAALFSLVARTLPIEVFLVGDRETMASVVGRSVGGWTDPLAGTVVLVGYGEHDVALRHELTHAISYGAWGPPHEATAWLAEGLATWIAGDCAGFALHDLAGDMRERGDLVPLRALLDEFPRQNDIVAYLQSGSIVGFIIETYGVDAFRRVWTNGEAGLDAIGLDARELERDWLRFIDGRAAQPVDREIIRAGGCG